MDSYVCYCYFIFCINQGMPAVQKRLPAICKMEIFLRMKKKTLCGISKGCFEESIKIKLKKKKRCLTKRGKGIAWRRKTEAYMRTRSVSTCRGSCQEAQNSIVHQGKCFLPPPE